MCSLLIIIEKTKSLEAVTLSSHLHMYADFAFALGPCFISSIYIWDSGQCNLGHSDSLNPVCVVAGWATPYYILLANLLLPYVNTAREGGAERPPAVIL